MNTEIDAKEVRLIDEDGGQVGVVLLKEALRRAEEAELDLVEISPTAKPPVCRVMDYGKFKYQQQKRTHDQRKRSQGTEMKQLRIKTFRIDPHDLSIKLKKAREFLEGGNRLLVTLMFRAREHSHADLGIKLLKEQIAAALTDISKVDSHPRKDGRRMTMTLAPLPNVKQIVERRKKQEEKEAADALRATEEEKMAPEAAAQDTPQEENMAPDENSQPDAEA